MSGDVGIDRISRRDFVKAGLVFGAGAAGLAAGYAAVPDVFARAVYSAKTAGLANDRILVVIQLAGGNDGLQTVIPVSDAKLRDLRPQLGKVADAALPLEKGLALNENLKGIKSLFDQGKVAIVQGVGYSKPSFSHFDSIRVWETADPERRQQDGWLGKTIAQNYDSAGHPLVGCACGATGVPGALRDLEATLIVTGTGVKILHVTLGGFDTHYTQQQRHDDLMGYLDQALTAFYTDLAGHGMSDRVLIATWSEFGRRPKENASAGTDHGTAAPVFLIGDTVKGGLHGEMPSLAKLDTGGNLGYKVVFRSVYQEILESHLAVDAKEVFAQTYE